MKALITIIFIAELCVLTDFIVYCLVTASKEDENPVDEKNEENNDGNK